MKKYIINLTNSILSVILIFSCDSPKIKIQGEEMYITRTYIENIIPQNLIFNEGVTLSPKMEKEFNSLYYILNKYDFWNERYKLVETYYIANQFYNKDKSIIIQNIIRLNSGEDIKTFDEYTYDAKGRITKIININEEKWEYNSDYSQYFSYSGDKLVKIKKNTASVGITETRGNTIINHPSEKYTQLTEFTYMNNLLIEDNYSNAWLPEKTKYYSTNYTNNKMNYIKIENRGTKIFGVRNDSIKFILVYPYSQNITYNSPYEIYLLSTDYNNLNLKLYNNDLSKDKTKYSLMREYSFYINPDYRVNRVIRKENSIDEKAIYITENYYEYHMTGSRLDGFSVFERSYDSNNKDVNDIEFEFKESFSRLIIK